MIYAIQAGESGPIKIGHTKSSPSRRLKELQTGNPVQLRLLGWCDGGSIDELWLHRIAAQSKAVGEWFTPTDLVLDVVAAVCGGGFEFSHLVTTPRIQDRRSSLANPESYRVQVWREANRDRYNARQKELMRKRRAN